MPVHRLGDLAATNQEAQPVMLELVRECHFKQKACALCGKAKGHSNHTPKKTAECPGRWPRGCAVCGRNKGDKAHFGAPKSFNVLSSGEGSGGFGPYASMKSQWQGFLLELLDESGLEKGLPRIYVEGEITFPDHRDDRDQGNFRVVLEKALGDALEEGGYVSRDDWDHYEFGGLAKREVPGESATRLMLYPLPPHRVEFPRRGQMELG